MEDVNISKFRAQVVRSGSTPASPGFVVSEGQNPVDPSGSGQNHLPVTIGSPANGLAVTDAQILTIDKAQIFAGTSSQFVKGDGTLDSTAYGTGTVTSVALTMPTAFSVANSPVTTTGTLAVTATGTTAQYIRGDGSLATFPALTGFVPYTGATADVNLGTHDLLAERGTFENNGSSNTLTVNHTSGSGYGIIVTKGGNNEALYVSKTSGSGNAMTVVGGRTSLVDLALSSVTNTAGDFLTLSGGVVHKRTAAQTLTDIGGQAALTNPVTGTGTTNYLPKFTGSTTIGNSQIFDNGSQVGIGTTGPAVERKLTVAGGAQFTGGNTSGASFNIIPALNGQDGADFNLSYYTGSAYGPLNFIVGESNRLRINPNGNLLVGTTTDAGFKLDVNGTGRFTSSVTSDGLFRSNQGILQIFAAGGFRGGVYNYASWLGSGTDYSPTLASETNIYFATAGSITKQMTITSGGDVLIGTTTTDVNTVGIQLRNIGLGIFVRSGGSTLQLNRTSSDGIIASFRTNDVERGSISIAGSVTSYNVTSDYRLKEDFQEIKGLEKVGAIKVYDYKWKLDEKRMDGVLAHELAEVLPYAVFGEKDEVDENGNDQMQSVDYSKIVPILIKAIQELQAKLDKNNIN
jgi:hypothetical protein